MPTLIYYLGIKVKVEEHHPHALQDVWRKSFLSMQTDPLKRWKLQLLRYFFPPIFFSSNSKLRPIGQLTLDPPFLFSLLPGERQDL